MNGLPQIPPQSDQLIQLARLRLEPLEILHAKELFPVLSDARLHEYIGGEPPISEESLAQSYSIRVKQDSPDGKQVWLNWVIREHCSGAAIGFVQALVEDEQTLVGWLIGVNWQSQGYAAEATQGLISWLKDFGFSRIGARIHPIHRASQRVAERAGLTCSGESLEGEEVWKHV